MTGVLAAACYDFIHDVFDVIGKRKERIGLCSRNIFILWKRR